MDTTSLTNENTANVVTTDDASVTQQRKASHLPNERLVLLVKDFALVSRLLTVRIYQVVHPSASGTDSASEFVGLRVAATDEVENDYALFISRAKGEQLHQTQSQTSDQHRPSPEAIASSVLSHLDIVGNRHRDVGRLTCRDPAVHVDHKPRAAPPRPTSSSSKQRPKADDKRASRNKQSQQRAMDAVAASHRSPHDQIHNDAGDATDTCGIQPPLLNLHFNLLTDPSDSKAKLRKSSEMSLLHRMANADATTVWRAELEGIDDESKDLSEAQSDDSDSDESETVEVSSSPSRATPQYKRALPERKPKYTELQRRRDHGRDQRLQAGRPIVTPPLSSSSSAGTDYSPPKRHQSTSVSPTPTLSRQRSSSATAAPSTHPSGNVLALKMIVSGTPPEAEQFLRRKTIAENYNRVFKAEGVFDDVMGVEITLERPDHRFHTPEHAPPSPDPSVHKQMKKLSKKRRSQIAAPPQATNEEDNTSRSRSGSALARVLLSPRPSAKEPTVAETVIADAGTSNSVSLGASPNELNVDPMEKPMIAAPSPRSGEASLKTIRLAEDVAIITVGNSPSEEIKDDKERSPRTRAREEKANLSAAEDVVVAPKENPPKQETADGEDHSLFATAITPPTPRSAREEDATLENISLIDDVALVAVGKLPDEEAAKDDAPGIFTDIWTQHMPRSARTSIVIDIHETDPTEDKDETEVAMHIVDANEEVVVAPIKPAGKVKPLKSARVECWEAVEAPRREERAEKAVVDSTVHHASEDELVENSADQPWVAPLQQVQADDDDEEERVELKSEDVLPEEARGAKHAEEERTSIPRVEPPAEGTFGKTIADDPIVEDPLIEVESRSQLQPSKDHPQVDTPPQASGTPSSLKHTVGDAASSHHGSIPDAATSTIAITAAAAAVTATAILPVEGAPPPSSKTKPASESTLTTSKRRSIDVTPSQADQDTSRQDGPRRSTIHLVNMAENLQPVDEAVSVAAEQEHPQEIASPTIYGGAVEATVHTPSSTALVTSDAERKTPHKLASHHHNRQRSKKALAAFQTSPTYHTKWHKWANGKQLLDKVGCLQLEKELLQDSSNAVNLVKLGLRYAQWPTTSLPAVLLLENDAVVVHDGASSNLRHEYWNALGNAHFDVFVRHRKFLPAAVFHLSKSLHAFTRTLAYLESVADPLLLLRYAICLYWKLGDDRTTNLEYADDIVRQLLSKFALFCDQDRVNVVFFHFQILCRLKMFGDAIECLHQLIAIHDAETPAYATHGSAPPGYDASDYLLMLMHCQQASGDFLQASATFTQLLTRLQQLNTNLLSHGSTLSDQQYLQMWGALADKCFTHEDYALAIEFYGIAVTYAKDSRVLARVLYNHALCYQAIGQDALCRAEFKRAKNINRHVVPFATLAELHAHYDDTYTTLLHTPVAHIIDDVRETLYDRAVTSLQHLFRHKKKDGKYKANAEDAGAAAKLQLPTSDRNGTNLERRQSAVATLTSLVEDSASRRASGLPTGGTDVGKRSAAVVDPHEAFLHRHAIALQTLEKIRARQLKRTMSMRLSPTKRACGGMQSGLLSPMADRPDLRRKHSMDSLARRLGYLPEHGKQFTGYWEQLVTTSLNLYETQTVFHRYVAHIRSVLPLATEAVACCALADAMGDVASALERLHDTTYEQELQLVSTVVDVTTILRRHFAARKDAAQCMRFPPIQSPVKNLSSSSTKQEPLEKQPPQVLSLPPCKSSPRTSLKGVRLSSLIDVHFEDASRGRMMDTKDAAVGQRLRDLDQFALVDDFRTVNASLLHGWQR